MLACLELTDNNDVGCDCCVVNVGVVGDVPVSVDDADIDAEVVEEFVDDTGTLEDVDEEDEDDVEHNDEDVDVFNDAVNLLDDIVNVLLLLL